MHFKQITYFYNCEEKTQISWRNVARGCRVPVSYRVCKENYI